jgi:hypothetical protein
MSFPALSPLTKEIVDLIQNTTHVEIANDKPFIQLTKFVGGKESIGYDEYKKFDLSKIQKYEERFPPIITGLECNLSGNLGTVRKAKVNIKFASSKQLKIYEDFLKIGNCQMVSWGWTNGGSKWKGNTVEIARQIVLSPINWRTKVAELDYKVDMMAGLLMNFNVKTNDDFTVDVELELGSPAELPGYLSNNDKTKTSSTDADNAGDGLVAIVQALDLDGELSGVSQARIENHSINHGFSAGQIFSWGTSSEAYIQFGLVVETICNKLLDDSGEVNRLDARYNIDDAVGVGHYYMVSCSENILFPNKNKMSFDKTVTPNGRKITPNTTRTERFGPFNTDHVYPEENGDNIAIYTISSTNTVVPKYFGAGKAGYIRNIYIRTGFLLDTVKGCKTVNDLLEKIIAEINVASAGLMNLVLKEMIDRTGKLIPSIADLNLVQDFVAELPIIDITTNKGRVIGLEVAGDLPKEMVGEMMFGDGSNADENPGIKMFDHVADDPVMKVASPETKVATGELKIITPSWWDAFTNSLTGKFQNLLNLPGNNLIKFVKQGRIDSVDDVMGVFKDVSVLKGIYFPKSGPGKRYSLLPTTVKIKVLGLSGIHIGSCFQFSDANPPVPWLAAANGFWQITNVEHSVDNAKWETSIEAKFRPGQPPAPEKS